VDCVASEASRKVGALRPSQQIYLPGEALGFGEVVQRAWEVVGVERALEAVGLQRAREVVGAQKAWEVVGVQRELEEAGL
jgi:hypothetical protein